ncbi:MAG: putative porin [Gammaproteobacteria bacterium]|nr:putative porin [Gammaproteobacteria bacterium]
MKKTLFLLTLISTLASVTAQAEVTDAEFDELRAQLAAVSQRLEELAAENAALKNVQAENANAVAAVQNRVADVGIPAAKAASWTDRIRMDGDFRYRYETIDVEDSSMRRRNRIRARANMKADLADNVQVGFGLATGGDDPVSTNQTLGAGGSSKGVRLNLAYMDWEPVDGLHLIAGKYKNPIYSAGKQPLLFDSDWTPEGLAFTYERDWFFANGIASFLESDTRRSNDTFGWGLQVGARGEVGGAKLTGGLAYYSLDTQGKATTFGDPTDPGDFFGNTAVESGGLPCGSTAGEGCVYLYDYLLTQAFAEASFKIGEWPTVVFADYVTNNDPSDNDTAWTLGARMGQTKDRGQYQFSYYYAEKEADAMLGIVTDSDFAGGGTDNTGHFLQINVGINKSWTIGAQYFINERDVASGTKSDYNRLMLDTQWKWK